MMLYHPFWTLQNSPLPGSLFVDEIGAFTSSLPKQDRALDSPSTLDLS
jgi:hypothetical protein